MLGDATVVVERESTTHTGAAGSRLAAFGSANYSREELIAEMGSAFLCAEAGIESTLDNSSA